MAEGTRAAIFLRTALVQQPLDFFVVLRKCRIHSLRQPYPGLLWPGAAFGTPRCRDMNEDPPDDDISFPDHWVRLMAEYASDGVWESDGCPGDTEELPISEALRADILAWVDWYERDCDDGLPDPRPFPREQFAAHGLTLARRLKAELPDWTVVYHDEQKATTRPRGVDRSWFEYEILLKPPGSIETPPSS